MAGYVLELGASVRVELEGAAADESELTVALWDGLATFRPDFGVRTTRGVRRPLDTGARCTTAVSPRSLLSSILATRIALETPLLKTAANPPCDRPRA